MNIGIDVGGTNLKAGVVSDDGAILAARSVPLTFQGAEALAKALADLAAGVMEDAAVSPDRIEAVGMGIPGAVKDGEIIYTANIPMENVPMETLFRRHLDLPVLLGNDADCAAVGEYFCGAGQGTRDFMVITLGTGIGGGMIFGGRLYSGMGMGGEVGHMVVEPGGLPCGCGRRGCWEQYASATGLIAMTRKAMEGAPGSLMHAVAAENGGVDGRTPFQAALRGDGTALKVCGTFVDYLAMGITNLVNILQPQRLAIGGGVAAAPEELLLRPLREKVAEECYSRHGKQYTEIVRARMGNDAGIVGAALLHRAR